MGKKILDILSSTRFWYAVVLAVAFFLEQYGIIPNAVAKTLELFTSLGIVVRTVDKFSQREI